MVVDVAWQLKDHAKTMLSYNLYHEIEVQFDSVWTDYFGRMVAATATALAAQQKALADAAKVEQEAQASLDRALWAFGLATDLTLMWLADAIQYRTKTAITAKLGWRTDLSDKFVGNKYTMYARKVLARGGNDDAAAQMFGDAVKMFGGLSRDWAVKAFTPKKPDPPNARAVASAANLEVFRHDLFAAVDQQKKDILANIDAMHNAIENDPEFGRKLLEKLFKENPRLRSAPPPEQTRAGVKMINDLLNLTRQQWALNTFYFGNNPPPRDDAKWANEIERAMWAVWLAQNRKMLLTLDMDEENREKSWFQTLIQYMFELGIPGTMDILTTGGPARDDAVAALVNRVKDGPDPMTITPQGCIQRELVSIENWTRK